MKRFLVGAALCFAVLASGVAHATDGYVCEMRRGLISSYGSSGFVKADYYSAPDCAGTYQGSRYYCSAGSTAPACSTDSNYIYTRDDLNTLATMFLTASIAGTKVDHRDTTSCNNAGPCAAYMYFRGTP
jgi:hypothetical protein